MWYNWDWTISFGLFITIFVFLVMVIIWLSSSRKVKMFMGKSRLIYLKPKIVEDKQPEPRSYENVIDLFKLMSRINFTYVSGTYMRLNFFNYNTDTWRMYEKQKIEDEQTWVLTKEKNGRREDIPALTEE